MMTKAEKKKLLIKHFKERPLYIYDDLGLSLSKVSENPQSEAENSL